MSSVFHPSSYAIARRRNYLVLTSLLLCHASAQAEAFSLGITKPLCNIITGVSGDIAIVIAVLGVAGLAYAVFAQEKGSKLMEMLIRTAAACAGLTGIGVAAAAFFPKVQTGMCA